MTNNDHHRANLSNWLNILREILPNLDGVPEPILRERLGDLREANLALDLITYRAACRADIEGVPV